jgi:hypothetical protein
MPERLGDGKSNVIRSFGLTAEERLQGEDGAISFWMGI